MSDARNPLDRLAESFVERYRRGERPSIEAWAEAHPDLADGIRDLFPTLVLMEELRPDGATSTQPSAEAGGAAHPGDRLGPYHVERVLGRGGMGTVYAALAGAEATLPEGTRVALKVIHPHLVEMDAFLERFLREADVGKRVDHPNVVRTLDVGLHEDGRGPDVPYLVLEHVEGTSLAELARSLEGALPETLLRHVARQIVSGLQAVHTCGIVHRDVKPSNVMITNDHRVRLMDLGVARLDDPDGQLSATGQFVGSVRYAAPEQFRSRAQEVGPAADLYALGVTLYEVATGRPPFAANSPQGWMLAHLDELPPSARSLRSDLSPFIAQVLSVLLEKDPGRRFPDAATLGRVLDEAEASAWWSKRRPIGVLGRPPVAVGETFRGREKELERIDAAWSRARAGDGRAVLLRGEAGVGKSALVDHFVGRLEGLDVRVLYGSFPPGDGPDGLRDAVVDQFGRAGLDEALSTHVGAHPLLVPAFAAFLRREPPPPDSAPLDADTLGTLFAHLLLGLSRERPLVWVVDDLQFASQRAYVALFAMLRIVPGHPVLLLATSRMPLPTPWARAFEEAEHADTIDLGRLTEASAREIVQDVLGTSPRLQDLVDRVVRDAGGNPLFLRAMLNEIHRRQEEAKPGELSSDAILDLPVPDAIRDVVSGQLGGVTEEERRILECGAIQGYAFDPELVSMALELDLLTVLQALGVLERRTGIVRSAAGAYRFDHHQLHEVLREQVSPPLAAAYHRQLAAAVARRNAWTSHVPADAPIVPDTILLVRHALEGGAWALAQPVVVAVLAAIRRRMALDLALRLCDRALELAPSEDFDTTARLRVERLTLLGAIGRTQDQLEESARAVDAAERSDDLLLRSEARRIRGTSLAMVGRREEGRRELEQALALAEEARAASLVLPIVLNLASVAGWGGLNEEAIALAMRGLEIARASGDAMHEAHARFSAAHYLTYAGRNDEAMTHLEAAVALTASEDSYAAKRARIGQLGVMGNVLYAQGRYAEAAQCYEESLDLCQRLGNRRSAMSNVSNLAGVALARGRLGEALAFYRDGVAMGQELGAESVWIGPLVNLAGGLLSAGLLEEAERWIQRALGVTGRTDVKRWHGFAMYYRARLDLLRGDLTAAHRGATEALAVRREMGKEGIAESHLLLAETDPERVQDHLVHALEAARAADLAGAEARAAWRLALLGRPAPTEQGLPRTASALERVEILILQAKARRAKGALGRARSLLTDVTASLEDQAERAAFRRDGPVWRLHDEVFPA